MKKYILTITLIALASASLAFARQPMRAPQWEYKSAVDFRQVQKLGMDGWELVAVAGGDAVDTFYLKRAK